MQKRKMDEMISHFNRKVANMDIDQKYKMELLGMITAIGIATKKELEQPEYEPVKAEDFAKTMSENTLYSFMAWHGEALALMKEQGFVICKKTM